ncbi:hypothetical protein, partial [Leptospira santarosai]|uniref:hypothetical protein n=1 Tax=Leptospira santarosai TaxID=28183 RepID=UPI003D184D8C
LRVEFLPPYALELNPREYIWCRWKRNYMANFCPENLSSLIKRTKSTTSNFKTYWKRSKLEYRYRDDNTSFVASHRVRPVKAPFGRSCLAAIGGHSFGSDLYSSIVKFQGFFLYFIKYTG